MDEEATMRAESGAFFVLVAAYADHRASEIRNVKLKNKEKPHTLFFRLDKTNVRLRRACPRRAKAQTS